MDKRRSIEERVDEMCCWTNAGMRGVVLEAMKALARDQRHLYAEAVAEANSDNEPREMIYNRVFNARIR